MNKQEFTELIKKRLFADMFEYANRCTGVAISYPLSSLLMGEEITLNNKYDGYTIFGKPVITYDSVLYEYSLITKRRCWEKTQKTVILEEFSEVK